MEESERDASEGTVGRSSAHSVSIVPYKDGPYIVRGSFSILAQDGTHIDAGRRTVALCRCGKSRMRPFCDGTHRLAGFQAPGSAEEGASPARVPLPPRSVDAVRRTASTSSAGTAPAEPPVTDARLSELLTSVHLAHAALGSALDEASTVEEHMALRLCEPLVRSAWALIETRALQPPAPPLPAHLPIGGRAVAQALIGTAARTIAELCEEAEDAPLETAGALLVDALAELDACEEEL
jgi:CDGSH-type Zn-finger protein